MQTQPHLCFHRSEKETNGRWGGNTLQYREPRFKHKGGLKKKDERLNY